jgi:hypothetical protein
VIGAIHDEYDPWATYDPSTLIVRRTPKRVRNHKPTLARIAKQAAKAGVEVARYEVDTDGKIVVVIGKADEISTAKNGQAKSANEWDEVFDNGPH